MTNLYFVRHAHSIYTPDEINRPLSENGELDAKKITEFLKNERITVVVSSPYKRSIQTVQGIANYIHVEVEVIDSLKERTLSIVPVIHFSDAITSVWEDYDFALEGGESNYVAQKRGVDAIFHLLENYKNENVVIGTHGNLMVLIMNFFDKQYDFTFWENLDMPDIYKLTFDGKVLKNVERLWGRL